MPHIFLATAHAPWFPHQNGFDPHWQPTENELSLRAYEALRVLLAGSSLEIEIAEMDRAHRCGCINEVPCPEYKTALRELTERAHDANLAIQVHIDSATRVDDGGPLALYHGGIPARQIALDLVASIERQSGLKRRCKHLYDTFFDGCLPVEHQEVRRDFGPKWFLDHGAQVGIILEVAAHNAPDGALWLRSPTCAAQIAHALSEALHRAYPIETQPCREAPRE